MSKRHVAVAFHFEDAAGPGEVVSCTRSSPELEVTHAGQPAALARAASSASICAREARARCWRTRATPYVVLVKSSRLRASSDMAVNISRSCSSTAQCRFSRIER